MLSARWTDASRAFGQTAFVSKRIAISLRARPGGLPFSQTAECPWTIVRFVVEDERLRTGRERLLEKPPLDRCVSLPSHAESSRTPCGLPLSPGDLGRSAACPNHGTLPGGAELRRDAACSPADRARALRQPGAARAASAVLAPASIAFRRRRRAAKQQISPLGSPMVVGAGCVCRVVMGRGRGRPSSGPSSALGPRHHQFPAGVRSLDRLAPEKGLGYAVAGGFSRWLDFGTPPRGNPAADSGMVRPATGAMRHSPRKLGYGERPARGRRFRQARPMRQGPNPCPADRISGVRCRGPRAGGWRVSPGLYRPFHAVLAGGVA